MTEEQLTRAKTLKEEEEQVTSFLKRFANPSRFSNAFQTCDALSSITEDYRVTCIDLLNDRLKEIEGEFKAI